MKNNTATMQYTSRTKDCDVNAVLTARRHPVLLQRVSYDLYSSSSSLHKLAMLLGERSVIEALCSNIKWTKNLMLLGKEESDGCDERGRTPLRRSPFSREIP